MGTELSGASGPAESQITGPGRKGRQDLGQKEEKHVLELIHGGVFSGNEQRRQE
jgi:succinate dehydrogenase/fumarate reductase flavoprotein subunit